ncbi:MAG: exodeoxyribonuclease V subunit alpha [Gammaproteobacteria bacterium]
MKNAITPVKTYSRLDNALARFLARLSTLQGAQQLRLQALIADLGFEQRQGHSCMVLQEDDRRLVASSGLVSTEGGTPLVLQRNRLYLHRYWQYENRLAVQVRARLANNAAPPDLAEALDIYFPPPAAGAVDWQRLAAEAALTQSFSMIAGGPGTGKTTTVVKILALLQQLSAAPLSMALAAPTGKAAARLQQAVGGNKQALPCGEDLKAQIPEQVTTLHRLLGARPPSPYFRHDAGNPLPHDVVVVDEASMVDLALMSKLFDALKADARLILLGDKDQLASVEAGAVLADLSAALPAHTVELQTAHRFNTLIKQFAAAVNRQDADAAWACLHDEQHAIGLLPSDVVDFIAQQQCVYLDKIRAEAPFAEIIAAFQSFQTLCAVREGERGVTGINAAVEHALAAAGRIAAAGSWYAGRPVLITQNDPGLHLYNGDVGICMPDAQQNGRLMVFFQSADGSVQRYLPSRLPHCETVFAMTIHKSQGSEFDTVLIVLPDVANPLLSKELLYTAVTRAKHTVRLACSETVFRAAVARKIERLGGLSQAVLNNS